VQHGEEETAEHDAEGRVAREQRDGDAREAGVDDLAVQSGEALGHAAGRNLQLREQRRELGPVGAEAAGHEADLAPGRPIGLDADYFQRIAAMEFVVKHDDGLNGEGLEDADIVLIGVSRTGKTPLSMYLGFQGYKTANVPLVRGIEPPGKLFQIDRAVIVGLTIEAERLAQIRGRRIGNLAGAHARDGYAELNRIHEELEQANALQRRLSCPVLDVSNLAVEEAAVRVIELVEARAA